MVREPSLFLRFLFLYLCDNPRSQARVPHKQTNGGNLEYG
jgi:hypothetical protein